MKTQVTRREFLKGSAAGAIGLAAMGLMGTTALAEEDAAKKTNEEEMEEEISVEETMDCDVVVVGAGGGGMWCAVQCAKAGANVIVVEKGPNYACSNSSQVGGTTCCNSRAQKEAGIEIDPLALFDHMMRYAEGTVNNKLVRRYIDESAEMMNYWMDLGVEIFMGPDRYQSGFETVHVYLTPNKMELLQNDAESNGATFLYSTTAKSIVMDGDAAAGIIAVDDDGKGIQINAKYVCIATGGFLGNPDMVKQYFGEANTIYCAGIPNCTGDGIQMALKAGAIMDTNFALSTLADVAGFNAKNANIGSYVMDGENRNQGFVFGNTGSLLVNDQGKRFINEYQLSVNPLAYGGAIQARVGYYYAIVDQALVDYYMEHSPYERVGSDPEVWNVGGILFDTVQNRLMDDIEVAISEGWGWKADTIEELQEALGMEALVDTINNYNEMYDAGMDTELGCDKIFMAPVKEGPFYALQYQCGALVTMGGIKTDDNCRALNKDNKPVPGLYVASSDNGSAFNGPYYDIGGSSSGLAMCTGYIAGEEIVKALGL